MAQWSAQVMASVLPLLLCTGALAGEPVDLQGGADSIRTLQVGTYRITVEVADTRRGRALGLMYRDRLAPDHGMLFVFDRAGRHCMFMRNTRIPLSAAFLDEQGRILAIARMQPFSERLHCAPRPVVHVLEMEQGWFTRRGIDVGDRIEGVDSAGKGAQGIG
jgi:uncharacterized membrane protein (UPF0127 family)